MTMEGPAGDVTRPLTGKVDATRVHPTPRRVPTPVIERYRRLSDPSGTVSDALDEFGLRGCIPASTLRPTITGACIVGTAVTVRNRPQRHEAAQSASTHTSRLAEIEGHNQARPGDVLVIEGVPGVSNMGGISCTIASRQGEVGAVVDGGIRDVGRSRALAFPVWSREVSPITGKWRAETVEINGPVVIDGIAVSAGDLVVADDTGVCFVPAEWAEKVVIRAEEIAAGEATRLKDIDAGMVVPELANRTYVYQYGPIDATSHSP